jgi:hypothetical protein
MDFNSRGTAGSPSGMVEGRQEKCGITEITILGSSSCTILGNESIDKLLRYWSWYMVMAINGVSPLSLP